MQQNLVRISRVFLAVMFLFSGISKLLSMPFFDGMVAELFLGLTYYDNPTGMFYTQILSRVLIAIELTLGVAILIDKWMKKFTLPALFGTLLLFTVHLFYEGITSDKGFIEGNCGCFGDVLPMNNLESIVKNVVAMVATAFVYVKLKADDKIAVWSSPVVIGLVTLLTLLMGVKKYQSSEVTPLEPQVIVSQDSLLTKVSDSSIIDSGVIIDSSAKVDETKVNEPEKVIPNAPKKLSILERLEQMGEMSDGSEMNLTKGTVMVCLFSMTCGHCQDSYRELCELSARATLPKMYLVNYGKALEQQYFFNQAGNCRHPYVRTEDYTKFNRLLEGKGFPRILVFQEGKIVQDWNIDSYNLDAFKTHFSIEDNVQNAEDGLNLKKKDDSFDEFEKNPWD